MWYAAWGYPLVMLRNTMRKQTLIELVAFPLPENDQLQRHGGDLRGRRPQVESLDLGHRPRAGRHLGRRRPSDVDDQPAYGFEQARDRNHLTAFAIVLSVTPNLTAIA